MAQWKTATMNLRLLSIVGIGLLAGCGAAASGDAIPSAASNSAIADAAPPADATVGFPSVLVDIEGREHRPFASSSSKALALVFILPDCPIANSFLPELNRLHAEYAGRGVELVLVHADPEVTSEEALEHAQDYEIAAPVILDPRRAWVQRSGASKTPEAAVFSSTGEVLYRGRINDQYAGLGKRRAQATTHDLRDALDATLADRPVPVPRTEVVGCHIPDL